MEGEPSKLQKDYHSRAVELIRQALECDEKSRRCFPEREREREWNADGFLVADNNEMAILLYKKGIQELEKAINLNIDPKGESAR